MSSIAINKLAARLYARTADGKVLTLNRKDLEAMFGIIQSEVETYERRISALQTSEAQQTKPKVEDIPVTTSGRSTPRVWPSSSVETKEG
jgi:hypothetical protein